MLLRGAMFFAADAASAKRTDQQQRRAACLATPPRAALLKARRQICYETTFSGSSAGTVAENRALPRRRSARDEHDSRGASTYHARQIAAAGMKATI
jgi:hypothetical protein